jgi:hypothetical protein
VKTWNDLHPAMAESGACQNIADDGAYSGMGTEVLRIRFEDTRLLGGLPADVEVVASLRPPHEHRPGPGWVNDPTFYLQIRHRYCVRCNDGEPLMIDYLQRFLRRYASLQVDEEARMAEVRAANEA